MEILPFLDVFVVPKQGTEEKIRCLLKFSDSPLSPAPKVHLHVR